MTLIKENLENVPTTFTIQDDLQSYITSKRNSLNTKKKNYELNQKDISSGNIRKTELSKNNSKENFYSENKNHKKMPASNKPISKSTNKLNSNSNMNLEPKHVNKKLNIIGIKEYSNHKKDNARFVKGSVIRPQSSLAISSTRENTDQDKKMSLVMKKIISLRKEFNTMQTLLEDFEKANKEIISKIS